MLQKYINIMKYSIFETDFFVITFFFFIFVTKLLISMFSLSIILPIYNVEKYIQRCLESILIQDNADICIECIIVDDCTPDGSMSIVRQILSDYRGSIRFNLLVHDKNRGLSAARNTGIIHAEGDYVLFMDSDDYLLPNSILYFVRYLNLYPDVDLIMGNVKNKKNDSLLISPIKDPLLISDCNVFLQRALRHKIYLYAWNKMIKRKVLIDNHIFFEEGIIYEDQCWSYQLFSTISSVLMLPMVTYIYEYNVNSIVNTTFSLENAEKAVRSYTISVNKVLDNPPHNKKYRRNLTVDYLLFMTYFLLNGVDIQAQFSISKDVARDFLNVRKKLLYRCARNGRLLLFCFFLLLFPPLSRIQELKMFRRHYDQIEFVVNRLSHLTDFLHNKNR